MVVSRGEVVEDELVELKLIILGLSLGDELMVNDLMVNLRSFYPKTLECLPDLGESSWRS